MKELQAVPTNSQGKGRWAEQLAERWLRSQGLTPCTQNYTRRLGEIDLILRDELNNTWVFVEVKYRSANARVSGVEAITPAKQRKLYRTADLFLQRVGDTTSAARIDVIVITQSPDNGFEPNTIRTPGTETCDPRTHIGSHELLWIQNAISG